MNKIKIQFVCLGNICRSPLAHSIFQKIVNDESLKDKIIIESSGTGAWHVGELPDYRMSSEALKNGYKMNHLARRFCQSDLDDWDLILAMDSDNYIDILKFAKNDEDKSKVKLFRSFDSIKNEKDVPDPYYGGNLGFKNVFEIVERTSFELLNFLKEKLK